MLPENENKNDGGGCHHCKVSSETLEILKHVGKQKNMKIEPIEFRFRRLFQKISEGEPFDNAIICYRKHILEWKDVKVSETKGKTIPFKWEYRLMIDLFICRVYVVIKQKCR